MSSPTSGCPWHHPGRPVAAHRGGPARGRAVRRGERGPAPGGGRGQPAPGAPPGPVAVIGAGRGEHSVGRAVLRKLRAGGFGGAVLAVNPHADGDRRRALLAVGHRPAGVRSTWRCSPCPRVGRHGRRGVRGARRAGLVLISSGLGGDRGPTERVRALADRYGMRHGGAQHRGRRRPGRARSAGHHLHRRAGAARRRRPGHAVRRHRDRRGERVAAYRGSACPPWWRSGTPWTSAHGTSWRGSTRIRSRRWSSSTPSRSRTSGGWSGPAAHLSARVPVLALESGTSSAGQRPRRPRTRRGRPPPGALREAAYAAGGIQSVATLPDLAAAVALLRGQPLPPAPRWRCSPTSAGEACWRRTPASPRPARRSAARRAPGAAAGRPGPLASTTEPGRRRRGGDRGGVRRGAHLSAREPGGGRRAHRDRADGGQRSCAGRCRPRRRRRHQVGRRPSSTCSSPVRPRWSGCSSGRAAGPVPRSRSTTPGRRRAPSAWRHGGGPGCPGPVGPVIPAGRRRPGRTTVVGDALVRAPDGAWLAPEVESLCRAAGSPTVPTAWVTSGAEAVAAARRGTGRWP